MSRSRYGSDSDDIEAARRKHAADDARDWAADRRATEQMWREGEARRSKAQWQHLQQEAMEPEAWQFTPVHSEQGRVIGWEAFLNDRSVGMLINTPHRGIAVIVTDNGEATVHYPGGRALNADMLIQAHQRWLEAGR